MDLWLDGSEGCLDIAKDCLANVKVSFNVTLLKGRVKACKYYGIHNFCEHSLSIFIFSSFFGDGGFGVGVV